MSSKTSTAAERLILAFQERYFADEAEGAVGTLADYIAIWPDQELLIAQEYMALRSGAVSDEALVSSDGLDRIGPYLLDDEIGRGGQGLVYKALDTRLGRTVALKVLTGLGPGGEKQIARFKREAEVAARLDHPGICAVHDAGVENGIPYIAMRFVRGETLGQRISRSRHNSFSTRAVEPSFVDFSSLDANADEGGAAKAQSTSDSIPADMARTLLDATLLVFEKAARALHAAHEAGVVHRDVKPGNIMITDDGDPVLLDFGLASDESAHSHSLTMTGDLFGTPAYMSPEQIAGQRIHLDGRSDVYSLGVTLYECLTLRRPWEAPTREALYQAIMTKEAPDPRRFNKSIPKDLKVILECALEKDRDKRYVSAEAFAGDLAALRENRPIAAIPIGPIGKTWRWAKRRPMKAALICVLAIGIPLVTGLGGFIAANLDDIAAQKKAEIAREVESHLSLGVLRYSEKSDGYGREEFRAALDLDPWSVEAVAGLVLALVPQRDTEEAEEALTLIREPSRTPEDRARLRGLEAFVLRTLGREEEADELRAELKSAHDHLGWYLAGRLKLAEIGLKWARSESSSQPEFREAMILVRRAVASSPRARCSYHLLLAQVAELAGEIDIALMATDALMCLWPQSYLSWGMAGQVRVKSDPQQAVRYYRRAAEIAPNELRVKIGLARALVASEEIEEASTLAEEARALAWKQNVAWFDLAQLFQELDDHQTAAGEYRRMLEKDPDNILALNNLAMLLANRLDQREEALGLMRRVIELRKEHPAGYINASKILHDLGRHGEALKEAERAIEIDPSHATAWIYKANALLDLGLKAEARTAAYEARACGSDSPGDLSELASVLDRADEQDLAEELYRRSLDLDPGNAKSHVLLGCMLCRLGRWAEAAVELEFAIAIDASLSTALNNLIVCYEHLGRCDEALKVFEKVRNLDPAQASPWMNIAAVYQLTGNIEAQRHSLEKAIELSPGRASYYREYARFLYRHGTQSERLAADREAVRLAPDHADYRVCLASVLLDSGEFEEAVEEAEQALALDPKVDDAHKVLGAALWRLGRREEATREFELAFIAAPSVQGNQQNLLATHRAMQRPERTLETFAAAVQEHPRDLDLRRSLGRLQLGAHQLDKALRTFEDIVKVDPDDAQSQNLVAWLQVDPEGDPVLRNPQAALAHARQAVAKTKGLEVPILDTLAVTLSALGMHQEALEVQKEILSLMKGQDVGSYRVGHAQALLEQYRAALKAKSVRVAEQH